MEPSPACHGVPCTPRFNVGVGSPRVDLRNFRPGKGPRQEHLQRVLGGPTLTWGCTGGTAAGHRLFLSRLFSLRNFFRQQSDACTDGPSGWSAANLEPCVAAFSWRSGLQQSRRPARPARAVWTAHLGPFRRNSSALPAWACCAGGRASWMQRVVSSKMVAGRNAPVELRRGRLWVSGYFHICSSACLRLKQKQRTCKVSGLHHRGREQARRTRRRCNVCQVRTNASVPGAVNSRRLASYYLQSLGTVVAQ